MKRRAAIGSLIVVTLAGGCELSQVSLAEPDDLVIVEVILQADDLQQTALVQRSLGLGPPPEASIRVRDEAGTAYTFLAEDPSTCLVPEDTLGFRTTRCYAWHAGPRNSFVRAGGRYSLEVETRDGRRLTGTTVVPGSFRITRPEPSRCHVPVDSTLELVWTRADDAWVYIAETRLRNIRRALAERGITIDVDPLRLVGLSISREDTTIVFPTEFGLFDRFDDTVSRALVALQKGLPPEVIADVVIAAADRNYVNWVRGGRFNPSGTVRVPSVHGSGGTGVFGSVVTRRFEAATTGPGGLPRC